jgi:hypothetical protein
VFAIVGGMVLGRALPRLRAAERPEQSLSPR